MIDSQPNVTQLKQIKRALVIEDDPLVARVCAKVLAGFGFTSDHAVNGTIALVMSEHTSYDFYLSEVRVPGINGRELFKKLSRNHSQKRLRIVFTAADFTGDVIGNIAADTSAPIVLKPFTPEELRKTIRKKIMEEKRDDNDSE